METDKNQTITENTSSRSTGTYVYDKKLGRVVKISNDIPSVAKRAGHENCGGPCCSGGGPVPDSCPTGGDMGGCCGGGGCCH